MFLLQIFCWQPVRFLSFLVSWDKLFWCKIFPRRISQGMLHAARGSSFPRVFKQRLLNPRPFDLLRVIKRRFTCNFLPSQGCQATVNEFAPFRVFSNNGLWISSLPSVIRQRFMNLLSSECYQATVYESALFRELSGNGLWICFLRSVIKQRFMNQLSSELYQATVYESAFFPVLSSKGLWIDSLPSVIKQRFMNLLPSKCLSSNGS